LVVLRLKKLKIKQKIIANRRHSEIDLVISISEKISRSKNIMFIVRELLELQKSVN
jgi:hypothetical protein